MWNFKFRLARVCMPYSADDVMEPLYSLFTGEEAILGRPSHTIVVSTWQKTPKQRVNFMVHGAQLAPLRSFLEECNMNYITPTGAKIFVQPSDYDFALSLVYTENLGYKHLIYDASFEDTIFQSVMEVLPPHRPKIIHMEFIEIPDSHTSVKYDKVSSQYIREHNYRCLRATSFSTSTSTSKYDDYLRRCEAIKNTYLENYLGDSWLESLIPWVHLYRG